MNKETFLRELREYLSVLEDQEQEDILEEYAQHIDMKMQKGLSEEEAICDFGPMKELAAEILEAYHVKPEFGRERKAFRLPKLKGSGRTVKKISFGSVKGRVKEMFTAAGLKVGRGFRWLGEKCRAFAGWLVKPFKRKKRNGGENGIEDKQMRRTKDMTGWIGKFFKMLVTGIVALWKIFIAFCVWCLRMIWNAGWLMFSILCAGMMVIVLSGLGAMCILLLQGYPLFGLSLISIGGILCFGSLSYGAFSLIIRKGKEEKEKEAEQSGEEVQYEQTA